jgi:hypothetical protein
VKIDIRPLLILNDFFSFCLHAALHHGRSTGTEEPINSGDDEEESDFLSRPFPYIQPDSLF